MDDGRREEAWPARSFAGRLLRMRRRLGCRCFLFMAQMTGKLTNLSQKSKRKCERMGWEWLRGEKIDVLLALRRF